jgi:hypothetical protein
MQNIPIVRQQVIADAFLVDSLEHLLRLGVTGVLVRVILERKTAILLLDLLLR